MEEQNIKLTKLTKCAGCGAKVGVFFWLRISVTCSSVKISRSGDLRPSTFRTDARLASTTRQPMAVRYSLLIRVRSFSNIL